MERDLEYENNNICFSQGNPDSGIKCKNYELCESVLPTWWFECKGKYLCTHCDMQFGKWTSGDTVKTGKGVLEIFDNEECPICLEVKRSISHPNCGHTSCLDCFKRCYYGDNDIENEPKFPYPNIEDEYYEDQDNSMWEENYPLIKKYNEELNNWIDMREQRFDNEAHLRKCPICRK